MKVISYNLNGIRSAISKGLWEWLAVEQPDVFCVQETKAQIADVDLAPAQALGYHVSWHSAEKKGYSGVATFSKKAPDQVVIGTGMEVYDREGRVLRTDFGDLSVLNCYYPSGSSGEDRQAFKMQFLADIRPWLDQLRTERPRIIMLGDFNIAHTERDIHDPKGNKNSSGFLPEEREWMTQLFAPEGGFMDAFRVAAPDTIEYSWWSFRFNARKNNKGWRIDYQAITPDLAPLVQSARHLTDDVHSDHCAIVVEYNI
jgi:exodeoxyribonuclease III